MERSKFALTLKRLRANANLTQKQMADALAVERSTYAYYETGTTHPSGEMILKLAKVFNVDYRIFMDSLNEDSFDDDYTTFSPVSHKEREKMYNITNDEQCILLAYRMMNNEKKTALMALINEK